MSQEEEKVLKDLVTQCLATKGFLGKIQAEIRAGVFVALEEQDVLKDIFINKPLKDFIETTQGALVISLVREFLEFFNLQFTNMVFDPETHAGIDYTFEGRKKLASDLNLNCEQDSDMPLLGLLLKSFDPRNLKNNKTVINGIGSQDNLTVENNVSEIKEEKNNIEQIDPIIENGEEEKQNRTELDLSSHKKLDHTMASLSDLPPLNEPKSQSNDNSSSKIDMKQLNELLQFEPDGGDANYEEDFVSSGSDKKDKTDSTGSDIEEELPSNSNHSTADDLTVDMTVSKESGQGDYTEKLSNS